MAPLVVKLMAAYAKFHESLKSTWTRSQSRFLKKVVQVCDSTFNEALPPHYLFISHPFWKRNYSFFRYACRYSSVYSFIYSFIKKWCIFFPILELIVLRTQIHFTWIDSRQPSATEWAMGKIWREENIKEDMKQEGKRFKVHLYQMNLNANPRAENKSVSTSYCGGKWGTGVFRCKSNSEVEEREAGCIPTHWQRAYSLFELQCWPAKHARSCTYTSVCTPEDRWGTFTSAHVMLPRIPGDALCKWCRL